MGIMAMFRRVHLWLLAYAVKWYRTKEVLRVFNSAHSDELKNASVAQWPQIVARQEREIAAVKAGRMDSAAITDRKSWSWPYLPACAAEDTEILTQQGFIPVAAMSMDDIFATRTASGFFEWQEPTAINKHRYKGKMVSFQSLNVDALVTPNHRMIARRQQRRGAENYWGYTNERLEDAGAICEDKGVEGTPDTLANHSTFDRIQIPIRAKVRREAALDVAPFVVLRAPKRNIQDRNTKTLEIDTDVWIQFLALYLADGSCDGTARGIDYDSGVPPYEQHFGAIEKLRKQFMEDPFAVAALNSNNKYRVRIACTEDSPTRQKTAELLAQIPVAWFAHAKGFDCGSKALWFALFEFGNSYTKYVPDFVKGLPVRELRLFVEWLKCTDGDVRYTGNGEYTTCSKQLAEDVQAILVRLGYAVRVTSRPSYCYDKESGATAYRVMFHKDDYSNIKEIGYEDYDGYVYCPSVPNGTICLRRNGKIFWTGNSIQRLSIPILKMSPYNLRRMSRTPVPRRAINLITSAVTALPWEVRSIEGEGASDEDSSQQARIDIATKIFKHPNNQDSFQTFIEMGLEDLCCLGGFPIELAYTPDPDRPLKMWGVMVESIRLFAGWGEATPDMPHYAQMTGLKGERGAVLFYDDEMLYIKDSPSSDNPFGIGSMEVAFQSLNDFLGVQAMAGRAGADQIHKCFPEWTEVLTRRGWIPWREAREDDEFATRSKEGRLQWQRQLGFVKEWHEGDLLQFHNRNLNITVTPNHRMYGKCVYKDWKRGGKRISKPVGFVEAKDLFAAVADRPGKGWQKKGVRQREALSQQGLALADFRIPSQSVWEDGALPTPEFQLGERRFVWEDWAAFLGIWIAEGSVLGAGKDAPPNSQYRIQIAQSKKANRATYAKIEALLKRMGFAYRAKSDRLLFTDRELWAYLSPLGGSHTKYVPQWLKDAPASLISVFVEWAMMGDGTIAARGKRVYLTASKRLADDMQELFQKIGSSAAVTPKIQKPNTFRHHETLIFVVEEMLRPEVSIVPDVSRGKQRMPERIPYSGYVYCAMVPNGTLYCRENGYAFWSGNTFLWWEAPQTESHIQIVRRYIQNDLEGQAKLSLIAGMKKPEPIEVTPVTEQDLLLNWQELLIRMIANAFYMSPMSLGIERDVNRSTGEVMKDSDFRTAVVPKAKKLQEAFTRKILHQKLGWKDLEFAFLGLDDPDLDTKTTINQKLYASNAITPNQIRKSMNMAPLDTPLADLTQAEFMLLNAEAAMWLQQQASQQQMQQQQQMMQMFPPQPPQPPQLGPGQDQQQQQEENPDDQSTPAVEPGKQFPAKKGQPPQKKSAPPQQQQSPGGGGGGMSKGGGAPLGTTKAPIAAPKPLSLPKFPITGSRYNARQVALMPVNQVTDIWKASGLTAGEFLKAMDDQEPGILQHLAVEVKQYFEEQLEEEEQDNKQKPGMKNLAKFKKELGVKVRKQNSRVSDMARWLYQTNPGKPGSGRLPNKTLGKPGNINPITRS